MQNDVSGRVIVKFDEIEYHLQKFYQMQSSGLGLGLQYPRTACSDRSPSKKLLKFENFARFYPILGTWLNTAGLTEHIQFTR